MWVGTVNSLKHSPGALTLPPSAVGVAGNRGSSLALPPSGDARSLSSSAQQWLSPRLVRVSIDILSFTSFCNANFVTLYSFMYAIRMDVSYIIEI